MNEYYIKADIRTEEKYSTLTLTSKDEESTLKIDKAIKEVIEIYGEEPEVYETTDESGSKLIVIEYEQHNNRTAGKAFEYIIKSLNITSC